MRSVLEDLALKGESAREASRELARLPTDVKNRGLAKVIDGLESRRDEILEANERGLRGISPKRPFGRHAGPAATESGASGVHGR